MDDAVARFLLAPRRTGGWDRIDHAVRLRQWSGFGGDFVEFLEPAPGRLVLVLGDVAGKGPRAALVAEVIRSHLRLAALDGEGLAEIAGRLDGALGDALGRAGLFATMILVELDQGAGVLRSVDLGHSYGMLLVPGGAIDPLHGPGEGNTPLGVVREPKLRVRARAFGPDDVLVLATDGLVEARDRDGTALGTGCLRALAECGRRVPTEVLASALEDRLEEHLGGNGAQDDLAFVLVRPGRARA